MNGLIPAPKSRFTNSFQQISAAIAGGACLFVGFALGSQVVPASNTLVFPKKVSFPSLEKQTVDFSKIGWISGEFENREIGFQKINTPDLAVNLDFTPYVLSPSEVKPYVVAKKSVAPKAIRIKKAVSRVEIPKEEVAFTNLEDMQMDYLAAAAQIKQKFFSTVYIKPISQDQMLALNLPPQQPTPEEKHEAYVKASTDAVIQKLKQLKQPSKKPAPQFFSVAIQQKKKPAASIVKVEAEAAEIAQPAAMASVTQVTYPSEPKKTESVNLNTPQTVSIQATQASAEVASSAVTAVQTANEGSSDLPESPEVLKEALLNEQLRTMSLSQNANRIAKNIYVKPVDAVRAAAREANRNRNAGPEETTPEVTPTPIDDKTIEKQGFSPKNVVSCEILANHLFFKPGFFEASQICPTHKEWISSETVNANKTIGWVKLANQDSMPTITRHPMANGGATLLLDGNAVAALAVKSGVRIAKGSGIIAGEVPKGYKVDFLGRGEEAEFFELNNRNYFAILNAEPGAGVIELANEKNQNDTSSVFVPVLQDTITFLDLAKPQPKNVIVHVVKNGQADDPEVTGLLVSLSTHRGIQAITQSQGFANLKNVNIIPGFPTFIDVTSKAETVQSYTYRYELKHKDKDGVYLLNQVAEKSIGRWVKQIPQGLSDQSAMVLGHFDRKKIDGFKNTYYPKVTPLSEKFGLEPLNYSILWDGKIDGHEPLEGDKPRFMSVQVPEGLSQVSLINEYKQEIYMSLIPVSPRVINVVSE